MKSAELIDAVGREPIFTPGMLLTPGTDILDVRKQLSRWTRDGTVVQLRRGLYSLGARYRTTDPHPFEVSNALVSGSYVSLETVLADRGLIPEAVFSTTAVTTGRQGSRKTPFGTFVYHHIKMGLFWGYEAMPIGDGRISFVATPEKALLDMAYLRTRSDEPGFARELRLQRLEILDTARLARFADRFGSRKVERFARNVVSLAREEQEEFDGA
jgi:hypothetical protein